jgi:hypothetical protein
MASAIAQFESATVEAARRWRLNVSPRPGVIATPKDYTAYTTVRIRDHAADVRAAPPHAEGGRSANGVPCVRNGKRPLTWLSGLARAGTWASPTSTNGRNAASAGAPELKAPVRRRRPLKTDPGNHA